MVCYGIGEISVAITRMEKKKRCGTIKARVEAEGKRQKTCSGIRF